MKKLDLGKKKKVIFISAIRCIYMIFVMNQFFDIFILFMKDPSHSTIITRNIIEHALKIFVK